MPKGSNLLRVMQSFKQICGMPNVLGAVDGTHIPIGKPRGNHAIAYFNMKNFTQFNFKRLLTHKDVFEISFGVCQDL